MSTEAMRLQPRAVLADILPGTYARDIALVVGGAALTGIAAQFSLVTPLSPVPFTLQTLAVLVVSASLGSIRAVLSMSIYLLAGISGVPWFAGHSAGWSTPSFGYVVGFVAAAGVVGFLARRGADRHVVSATLLLVTGALVIYLIGGSWLAVDLHLSAAQTFDLGIRPFLVTDAAKITIAALAFPSVWRLVRR